MIRKSALFAMALCCASAFAVERVDVHPHQFVPGGWSLDAQFMDVMGSPYLIAHGKGIRVADATAQVEIPKSGTWRVWVRSRKWTDGAGSFAVHVNGATLGKVFGASQFEWNWEDGGAVELQEGKCDISLVDGDGFDGRCAGIALVLDGGRPQGALDFSSAPCEDVEADLVVVGGGLPGTCAAVAAARRGLRVALVQDRPMLGGNASSEIRVWSGGEARHPIVKELRGWFMNRDANMAISDAHRLRVVQNETNICLRLSTRAFGVEKDGSRISAVRAFDWAHGRLVRFRAPLFCDATGDGWVGFWAGADFRTGREAKDEFGETFAPEKADGDTLGASLMWTSAVANTPVPFSAPWAESHAQGEVAVNGEWNWEYGIHRDMIAEGEAIRDRLLLATYGAFSLAKRDPVNSRRVIDFLPFVLGKRESRRLLGDWIYSESDVTGKRKFPDAVATGSWSVDLHYDDCSPGVDFLTTCRQPHYGRYWIPYRSLYSRNVENLFMAGRCFSCTHVGLGGARVINTLAQLGVAVGEAAAMCRRLGVMPRGIWTGGHARELQRLIGGDFPGNPDPAYAGWLIVDDEDEGVKFLGGWRETFCCNGGQVGDKVHEPTETAGRAVYPLPVEKPGLYRLMGRINYRWDVKDDSETLVVVFSGGRRIDFKWNQAVRSGEWNEIGAVELSPGATLELDVRSSHGTVVADAFAIAAQLTNGAVVASVDEAGRYADGNPHFLRAVEFLRGKDLAGLAPGRHEIDGTNCWAMVFDIDLKPWGEQNQYESHRDYIDIHIPVSGDETIGSIKTPDAGIGEFDENNDCVLFKAMGTPLKVFPGEFAVFFPPEGGHAPGLTQGSIRKHRKIVLKVLSGK